MNIDWLLIEKEFTEFYMKKVYEGNPMTAYDITQWFRNRLKGSL